MILISHQSPSSLLFLLLLHTGPPVLHNIASVTQVNTFRMHFILLDFLSTVVETIEGVLCHYAEKKDVHVGGEVGGDV